MSTSRRAALAGLALAASLVAGLTPDPARAGEAATPASRTAAADPHACRVKDHAGGATCTARVPEKVCAAIAREASGTYTWTAGDCP